ncbi:MAG: hypothetical protein JWO62_3805 [Acidimicrobiaceae bacterium]|nr:hypothetical protein [Acidimicrobiaceae bacterium]
MELTADKVWAIVADSMFKDDEEKVNPLLVEGITAAIGFHPDRLKSHKLEILELLHELPDSFQDKDGQGESFLKACTTKEGVLWGNPRQTEMLFILGLGAGVVKMQPPRSLWKILPGGVPYLAVIE